MAKKVVGILGWIFVALGILGFIPGITSGGMLLGIFEVSATHNIVHLVTGLLAVWSSRKGEGSAKMFAKVFGIIYALVFVLGLIGSGSVLGLFHANGADHVLHIVIAALLLWAGFAGSKNKAPEPMSSPAEGAGM